MKTVTKTTLTLGFAVVLMGTTGLTAIHAADESKVDAAAKQVERGAKDMGDAVQDTAKGVGNTVVEGSKLAGEKLKEAGQAAEPEARGAWTSVKEGATSFGRSVRNFFSNLFSSN